MTPPSVYLDTSVPSYLVAPLSRVIPIARQQRVTCLLWNAHRDRFRFFVSRRVTDEAKRGNEHEARKRLEVLAAIPSVEPRGDSVNTLIRLILRNTGLPECATEDAEHVAIAASNDLDYLVTWNCKHLANPQITPKVARTCERAGLRSPVICTPEDVLRRFVYRR